MMKRTLLISTDRSSFRGALWGAYDLELPLNTAYVSSYLELHGIGSDIIDLQLEKDVSGAIAQIDCSQTAVVGLNANLGGTYNMYDVAAAIKKKYPDIPVACFGLSTVLKEKILEESENVDYVVFGEEEETFRELAAALIDGRDTSGIKGTSSRRDNGEIICNLPRGFIRDLDAMPFPGRHLFDVGRYFPSPGKYMLMPQFTMISSRGCNGACLFCPRLYGRGIRYRSPANIAEEIDMLEKDFGAREIYFLDDTFTADRDRTMEIADMLSGRKKRIAFRIASRVDKVDRKMLKALKAAGLYSIGFGIESGVDEILKFNRKGITTEQVKAAVSWSREAGLETRGFFMLNLPGDTQKTTRETIRFIRELKLDLVNVQIAYPWPGSELRKYVLKNCDVSHDVINDWTACEGDRVTFTQNDMTPEFIFESYNSIIKEFYLNPRFILRWLSRIRNYHDFKYAFLQFLSLAGRMVAGVKNIK